MAELSTSGICFHYRGDTTNAYYADGHPVGYNAVINTSTAGEIASVTGAFASSGVGMRTKFANNQEWGHAFSAKGNLPSTVTASYLFRVVPSATAPYAANYKFINTSASDHDNIVSFRVYYGTDLKFYVQSWDSAGLNRLNFFTSAYTMTANTPYEVMVTLDWGTLTSSNNKITIRDNVGIIATATGSFTSPITAEQHGFENNYLGIGRCDGGTSGDSMFLIEAIFWNTTQSHDYTLRTDYFSTSSKDITNNSSPAASNVLSGTSWIFNGTTLTGTYHDATYTDPGIANVKSGESYIFNDSTLTGTYALGTYTTVSASDLRSGVSYIYNDATITGTLNVPTPSTGPAGALDLNNIKETIRFILAEANTTTASPVDLSANLSASQRVKYILKHNPNKIKSPLLRQNLPLITIWMDDKGNITEQIAKNQLSSNRRAEINFNIMGMVQNIDYSDKTTDPADDEIEKLMENIELVLRAHTKLNNTVLYQVPESIEYHTLDLDNKNHIRVGLLSLKCRVEY